MIIVIRSRTQFKENYNVVKVLTNKTDIMKQQETFNSNNQAVAFGIKKKPRDSMPEWFRKWSEEVFSKDIKSINTRLDNIETRLDQHDALFKKHGWIDK